MWFAICDRNKHTSSKNNCLFFIPIFSTIYGCIYMVNLHYTHLINIAEHGKLKIYSLTSSLDLPLLFKGFLLQIFPPRTVLRKNNIWDQVYFQIKEGAVPNNVKEDAFESKRVLYPIMSQKIHENPRKCCKLIYTLCTAVHEY